MRGIAVSDDRIAVDVIEAVGHDGSFLAEAHTVQNFRKELWFPKLLDRQYWSNWMVSGTATHPRDRRGIACWAAQAAPLDPRSITSWPHCRRRREISGTVTRR
jgi:trimethylamine:corrinoid methyltransferase-like protein